MADAHQVARLGVKPEGYPLPWCKEVGVAYWRINLHFCGNPYWARWQRDRSMAQIIPVLRWRLNLSSPPEKAI